MNETLAHSMKISCLKARIERSEYAVDVDAVATAFVAHLLSRRALPGDVSLSSDDARSRVVRAAPRPS